MVVQMRVVQMRAEVPAEAAKFRTWERSRLLRSWQVLEDARQCGGRL
jgi:hypothetical protein